MKKHKVNKKFVFQKLDRNALFFDDQKSVLYTLNETAYFILKSKCNGMDESQISEKMLTHYESKGKSMLKDVKKTIAELIKSRIIVASEG